MEYKKEKPNLNPLYIVSAKEHILAIKSITKIFFLLYSIILLNRFSLLKIYKILKNPDFNLSSGKSHLDTSKIVVLIVEISD